MVNSRKVDNKSEIHRIRSKVTVYCILFRMKLSSDYSIQVEAVNALKLKTFKKCDDSYLFTLYVDKPKDGTYYVVYLPKTLKVWRTRERDEAELLRDQLNSLKLLINMLGNISKNSESLLNKNVVDVCSRITRLLCPIFN